MINSKIKVGEMCDGVGGFHLKLTRASQNSKIDWANQYEPSRKNNLLSI